MTDADRKLLFEATTNDERFDGNDHVRAALKTGQSYWVSIAFDGQSLSKSIHVQQDGQLFEFVLES